MKGAHKKPTLHKSSPPEIELFEVTDNAINVYTGLSGMVLSGESRTPHGCKVLPIGLQRFRRPRHL
jgi:hypothetical protein